MAGARPLYIGPRLRRLRRELGLTQQVMADDLAISPSYVALLERNQRPVTADMLMRLARTYRLDMGDLATDDLEEYARRIGEVLRDPIFADIDLPALEVGDLATTSPGIAEALLRLHGAYVREQQALADRRVVPSDEPLDPVTEERRFIAGHRNYYPEIDARAEELAGGIAEAGGLQAWLERRGTRVRVLPAQVLVDTVRRFDRHNDQLLIADTLDARERGFQQALHIAYTSMRAEMSAVLRSATFTSPTTEHLVRRTLGSYAAAALMMPYDAFARAAEARLYDVEALARQFETTFEQVAQRLTTLNRAGAEGVPFFLIRVDEAGNVSKRLDGAGLPFAHHGGGCPLWSVHRVFRSPGEIVTQWLELPDSQRLFSVARTVPIPGAMVGSRRIYRAIALVCAAEHAPRLAYAQGSAPALAEVTPIGVTCRLCHRTECTARSAPPIGRDILPDDNRRTSAPFIFSES